MKGGFPDFLENAEISENHPKMQKGKDGASGLGVLCHFAWFIVWLSQGFEGSLHAGNGFFLTEEGG